ncbi:MAG: subtype I-F CRISPR-associated endonuclease Cas1 [Oceanospirillaceae bacterium]|uniref:type I-F CRISPR-associated endonuclease Cas1f n=1 Tax=unclassified Thalassolituus TaxID=2624967 RepID=UPI000C5B1F46|nr:MULTISPECIES: type I-F CRISPR-associated endonuclease Cas1f [unclassified Thalassolituus]MAS24258.1 subtype I-F CRISPR-associated endonuclease Cas1 [Oceanospirillaceae bacterium]MAX99719.1 subtype I-F CRISPR-associated endonuclease Cas1 [Oceanospirillaceae bacterium]MBL35320.1 subtype I-F CRISPR-associated endonuclease Cas1 [Oceanospirillaceae bacterium]MBS53555.1 subtype I-F CRISPR-associated endonuclease Cas1 [Oceanospirillaceae bacterium]|tara:strand:+ start:2244 stop:3236 length:993 start_codon:yes stop_codon:yes gene_type:complete
MEDIAPSDLKTIIHSKRANIYYLQYCRVLVNGGRVEYVTEAGKESLYWNIPIANTTVILLGTGTSITQAAVREFAKSGVLIGFCGGGGTPLFACNEVQTDVEWLTSQSEYRPTEYLQLWCQFWFNESLRLDAAIRFQQFRLENLREIWNKLSKSRELDFPVSLPQLDGVIQSFEQRLESANNSNDVLATEAVMTKALYKLVGQTTGYGEFTRAKQGGGLDIANRYLDHGNYLAYGLAATACWVLGLPHGLAVLHGKTRRGGLVFDVADLIKDAIVMPVAFISAIAGHDETEFRQQLISQFQKYDVLDRMIEAIKAVAEQTGRPERGISKA